MAKGKDVALSRRERQIMDAVYRLGSASVADIRAELPDAPSYSAVRALLKVLEDKGHLTHTEDGPRYVYAATTPKEQARTSALRRVVRTFFDDSTEGAVAALLDLSAGKLSGEELERLAQMIDEARREGR